MKLEYADASDPEMMRSLIKQHAERTIISLVRSSVTAISKMGASSATSGIAPIPDMRKRGVNVSLATDGVKAGFE